MALEQEFNLDLAGKAPQQLAGMSVAVAGQWLSRFEQDAAANPALAAAAEEAFIKQLKTQGLYSDVLSGAAAGLETGRDKPETSRKLLSSFSSADPGGIEGIMRKDALVFSTLLRLRGAATHPAIRFYAEGSAKLSDDDFKNLAKPLRLLIQTIAKAKIPVPAAPRKWVGDKPKGNAR